MKIRNGRNNWTLNRQAKIISRVPLEGEHYMEGGSSVSTTKYVTLAEFGKCKPSFLYFRT